MPMFKALRITLLLLVLVFVAGTSWLASARSTDWNNSLWVKVYPINADGSEATKKYIDSLSPDVFADIEAFMSDAVEKYGRDLARPVRIELGREVHEQPPPPPAPGSRLAIAWWSLKMRLWAHNAASGQDRPAPDVRLFVRYHDPDTDFPLENSVGLRKGMLGIVNAFASRRQAGSNNVVIVHEFLHTLGATDKYDFASGQPRFPDGYGEPNRSPRFPQRYAEIMAGRIALSDDEAVTPGSLKAAVIGAETAAEIRLSR